MQKIHFINRVDDDNAGDQVCSPYNYFYDYFRNYNCLRHDIDYINWIEISPSDVIIIGASGMLYVTEDFQKNMNKLLDICPTVIAWSIGFNTHSDRPIITNIDTSRFKLIGIRDYMHPSGLPYLPCVSCFSGELDKTMENKRKIGIIDHKYFPVPIDIAGERINNSENFQIITDFIASSEIVISSSYHIIFWSILMGKKTICANPFSTKFDYFIYKPVFYSGNLEEDIKKTQIYPHAIIEARELNNIFFNNVKKIIETVINENNNIYQNIYEASSLALLRRRVGDIKIYVNYIFKDIENINSRIDELHNSVYDRIDESIREVHTRIDNLYYDVHSRISSDVENIYYRLNEIQKQLSEEINQKTSLRYFVKRIKLFICKILFNKLKIFNNVVQ